MNQIYFYQNWLRNVGGELIKQSMRCFIQESTHYKPFKLTNFCRWGVKKGLNTNWPVFGKIFHLTSILTVVSLNSYTHVFISNRFRTKQCLGVSFWFSRAIHVLGICTQCCLTLQPLHLKETHLDKLCGIGVDFRYKREYRELNETSVSIEGLIKNCHIQGPVGIEPLYIYIYISSISILDIHFP